MAGGFNQWKQEGLPVEVPRTLSNEQRERYGRHLLMPEVGERGQLRLAESSVLLIGAGGARLARRALPSPPRGVGRLGIVDDDVVDRSNLQRQILHTDDRVGKPKVASAERTLRALNPDVEVVSFPTRLTSANVDEVFAGFDVVLDGSDNFPTRYLVNDACVKAGVPNVHGSIYRFEGQVSVFWPAYPERRGPCYRCLYAEPPPPELAPSCAEAGVLGVLPGVVGTLEAIEAIKHPPGRRRPACRAAAPLRRAAPAVHRARARAEPGVPLVRRGRGVPGLRRLRGVLRGAVKRRARTYSDASRSTATDAPPRTSLGGSENVSSWP